MLLVPTGEPPHRRLEPEPGREARLEMTRLAVEDDDALAVSEIETEREGPSFTIRTLELLRERRPADEPVLLMGADAAAGLESWHEPQRVVELARIGVAARPGVLLEAARAALERLGVGGRMEVVDMPEIGVSSSAIRRRVATGRPIRYLTPDRVAALILERGLYVEAGE